MKLKGKVALITGAGRGIGKAVAQAYAREGTRLALCASDEGKNVTGKMLSCSGWKSQVE